MSTTTPYSFIKRGNLFIIPVGPSIAEVPYPTQSYTKPREYSLWVNGGIEQPAFQLDHARMPPSLFQDVRNDLVRYSPVEVTRSAFARSNHAYVGVIDSKGTPYYFALDSRGMSVREVDVDDDRVWKTFDRLSDQERAMAVRKRRSDADVEMTDVDRELSEPKLVIKAYSGTYKPTRQRASWWRNLRAATEKPAKEAKQKTAKEAKEPREPKPPSHAAEWRDKYPDGKVAKLYPKMKALSASSYAGKLYASEMRRIGHVLAIEADEEDLDPPREDDVDKAMHPAATWIASELHAGRQVKHENGTRAYRNTKLNEKTGKTETSHFTVVSPHGMKTIHTTAEDAGTKAHAHTQAINKALPKKSKEATVKKTPSSKASKKKVGAGGKPRYTYPNEKKGGAKPGAKQQAPLVVAADHDDSKHADPGELANQLGVSVRTLQHTAKHLGREAFSKFMRSHLKRFAAKHRLDPDYWGTLYERLRAGTKPPEPF